MAPIVFLCAFRPARRELLRCTLEQAQLNGHFDLLVDGSKDARIPLGRVRRREAFSQNVDRGSLVGFEPQLWSDAAQLLRLLPDQAVHALEQANELAGGVAIAIEPGAAGRQAHQEWVMRLPGRLLPNIGDAGDLAGAAPYETGRGGFDGDDAIHIPALKEGQIGGRRAVDDLEVLLQIDPAQRGCDAGLLVGLTGLGGGRNRLSD